MKNISGVSGAGPIFHRTLVRAHRDTKPTWFPYPTGGETVSIDTRTGQKLAPNQHPKFSLKEWIPQSTGLSSASPSDYDEKGRAKLPPIYRDWYQSPQNLRRHELTLDQTATNNTPLQVLRPINNSTILLDPEIPDQSNELHLLTNLPEKVTWTSETLKIRGTTAHLTPGTHTLTATDTRDGTEHLITITVKKL